VADIRERFIGRLAQAAIQVLPELTLKGLADPLSGGTFRFAKGTTSDFPYKNLSGGESGKPADDWKATKGDIYNACKRILQPTADVFLAEQLAPVIRPGLPIYEELQRDIFGCPTSGELRQG
jgi:hypothetical protein